MTVTKYRSVEEMPSVVAPRDATLGARIRALWKRSLRLAPPAFPRGIGRFRGVAEADAARTRLRTDRLRERAAGPGARPGSGEEKESP